MEGANALWMGQNDNNGARSFIQAGANSFTHLTNP